MTPRCGRRLAFAVLLLAAPEDAAGAATVPLLHGSYASCTRAMMPRSAWLAAPPRHSRSATDAELLTTSPAQQASRRARPSRMSSSSNQGGEKPVSKYMPISYGTDDPRRVPTELPVQTPAERVPTKFQPHAASLVPEGSSTPCVIKVVGVGGGGGNAINRMVQTGIQGVEFWSVNTDAQALSRNLAPGKLAIGQAVTRGLGAGGNPNVGRRAAEESKEDLALVVQGADMVFVTAGMGGGTGSGAAPLVAEAAREQGSLTVGVVTKPFGFEGRKRMQQANEAIAELRQRVDTLIVVANDKLLQIVPENTPLQEAFLVADDILRQGVVGISEIIIKPGLVNVDFADVRSVMSNAGTALMGVGRGKGKARAADAALAAISSPLLDFPVKEAKGIVFNIIGDADLTLQEINEAAQVIYRNVDPDANIIFGALVDPTLNGELHITVLATGFSAMGMAGAAGDGEAAYAGAGSRGGGAARAAGAGPIRTTIPPALNRPAVGYYEREPAFAEAGAGRRGAGAQQQQQQQQAAPRRGGAAGAGWGDEQPAAPAGGQQRPPPSLSDPFATKNQPKGRKRHGIFGFLKRILLGR